MLEPLEARHVATTCRAGAAIISVLLTPAALAIDWSLGWFSLPVAPGDQERHVNLSLTIFWRSGV
jgi:hypothetical protein